MISRHRGAKRLRRFDLWGVISLLSPAYLLSVERYLCHTRISGHYDRRIRMLTIPNISVRLVSLTVKQVSAIALNQSSSIWTCLCTPPLLFRRRPPQSNYQSSICFHSKIYQPWIRYYLSYEGSISFAQVKKLGSYPIVKCFYMLLL